MTPVLMDFRILREGGLFSTKLTRLKPYSFSGRDYQPPKKHLEAYQLGSPSSSHTLGLDRCEVGTPKSPEIANQEV